MESLKWTPPTAAMSEACKDLKMKHRGASHIDAMFRTPPVNSEQPLAFLHIPKNAGSTVYRAFGRLRIRDDEYHNDAYPNCNNRHVPPRYWKPKNPFYHHKVFCIIRDPVDKAISEFKMRHAGSLNEKNVVQSLELWLSKRKDWSKGGEDCHMVPQHAYVWDETGDVWII